MSAIGLVVFDMAGTTVRDRGDVATAFMNAFREYDLEAPVNEVRKVMGFRKIEAVKMLLNKINGSYLHDMDETAEKIHDAFTRNMIRFYESDLDLRPFPHAESTFRHLQQKGVKVALNTGFTKGITDVILQRLQWTAHPDIDQVISSDEVPQGRPHPFMIRTIMQRLGVQDAASVAKVGDTEVDVKEGRNAGCGLVVGVTTGAYSREQLHQYQPDRIIDSLEEISSLI